MCLFLSAVDCGMPEDLSHATKHYSDSFYLSEATYECISKYWVKRGQVSQTVTCNSDKNWCCVDPCLGEV